MTIPEVPSGLDYNVFPFAADSRLLVDNWGTLQCKSVRPCVRLFTLLLVFMECLQPEWCVTGRYIIPVGLKLRTKPYAGYEPPIVSRYVVGASPDICRGDFVECSVSEGESGLVYTCRLQDGRSFESSYSSSE